MRCAVPSKSRIVNVPCQPMVMSMARRWVWRLTSAAGNWISYFAIIALAALLAWPELWPQAQSIFTPAMGATEAGSWPLPPIMQHQCIR